MRGQSQFYNSKRTNLSISQKSAIVHPHNFYKVMSAENHQLFLIRNQKHRVAIRFRSLNLSLNSILRYNWGVQYE